MEQVQVEVIKTAAAALVGYAWQWTRAPQKFPNWVGYLVFAAVVFVATLWAVPDVSKQDWRLTALVGWNLFSAARGNASMSRDVKAAPATNAL